MLRVCTFTLLPQDGSMALYRQTFLPARGCAGVCVLFFLSSLGWLCLQGFGVGIFHTAVLCTSADGRRSEWKLRPSPPRALLWLLHHTFPVWQGCWVTGSSQKGTRLSHFFFMTQRPQVHLCMLTCPLHLVNTVSSSLGVVHFPELDHHGGAGRETDCSRLQRFVGRDSKGAAAAHSGVLHASGQLSPGNEEIHTGRQQAEGRSAARQRISFPLKCQSDTVEDVCMTAGHHWTTAELVTCWFFSTGHECAPQVWWHRENSLLCQCFSSERTLHHGGQLPPVSGLEEKSRDLKDNHCFLHQRQSLRAACWLLWSLCSGIYAFLFDRQVSLRDWSLATLVDKGFI